MECVFFKAVGRQQRIGRRRGASRSSPPINHMQKKTNEKLRAA